MESKNRIPPPFLRRPIPGPGLAHLDQFGPGPRLPPGAFPPVDMLPPPDVMEQKLAAQHMEMQRLATENQRLAATHGTLRQELAAAQHELQILHAQIGAIRSEREQQMRNLMDKIAKMEPELKAAESVKLELQKARTDAQKLVVARQEFLTQVRQLNQDLQRAHTDTQQIPALMSELEGLRQEYHQCRVTYDYEKKLYDDHLQQLQVMEKNYMTMAADIQKLRAELSNLANVDGRTGGVGGNNTGEVSGHTSNQSAQADSYSVPQHGRGPVPANAVGAAANPAAGGGGGGGGVSMYSGAQPGARPSYDPSRAGYDHERVSGYSSYRGPGYDTQKGPSYDAQRGTAYDMQRGNYSTFQGPMQGGPGYDASRGPVYDAQNRGPGGQHGQMPLANSAPYASATPPSRAGAGYDAPSRGVNQTRK